MGKVVRRLLAAGGVLFFAFSLGWSGGVAHANCATMPDDPMCQGSGDGMTTSPPVQHTSPPVQQTTPKSQSNTHTTSNSSSNRTTPPPTRTVTRTPQRENLTPRRQPTFQPSVPAAPSAPAENFQPASLDPTPLPAVELGQIPIPQPSAAPPPPPPPAAKSDGPGPVPLALGGALGVAGAAAIAQKRYDDDFKASVTKGVVEVGGGMALLGGVAVGLETGALAFGATAILGPALFAVGFGLVFIGAVDLLSVPKVQPTGAVAHAGSVRG